MLVNLLLLLGLSSGSVSHRSVRRRKRESSVEVDKQRLFFDEISARVGVTKPEDWYSVTVDSVIALGGSFVNTQYHGSLTKGSECTYTTSVIDTVL